MLTIAQIEELANQTKVKKVAVENFLTTLRGLTKMEACMNLITDSKIYNWNKETIHAIRRGINLHFKKG